MTRLGCLYRLAAMTFWFYDWLRLSSLLCSSQLRGMPVRSAVTHAHATQQFSPVQLLQLARTVDDTTSLERRQQMSPTRPASIGTSAETDDAWDWTVDVKAASIRVSTSISGSLNICISRRSRHSVQTHHITTSSPQLRPTYSHRRHPPCCMKANGIIIWLTVELTATEETAI